MICPECASSFYCQAFDEGTCQECGCAIITSHMPHHVLCPECASRLNKCEQCGEEIV
jgi:hypothetical protein